MKPGSFPHLLGGLIRTTPPGFRGKRRIEGKGREREREGERREGTSTVGSHPPCSKS